jgi:hypothetical protein
MDAVTLGALSLPGTDGGTHRLGSGASGRWCWSSSATSADCTAASTPSCGGTGIRSAGEIGRRHREPRLRAALRRGRADSLPRAIDDDGRARAASVPQVSWYRLLHPGTWHATWKTYQRGHRVHAPGPRVTQLGATFILGPGSRVRYAHVDRDSTDHAPIEALLDAVTPA